MTTAFVMLGGIAAGVWALYFWDLFAQRYNARKERQSHPTDPA